MITKSTQAKVHLLETTSALGVFGRLRKLKGWGLWGAFAIVDCSGVPMGPLWALQGGDHSRTSPSGRFCKTEKDHISNIQVQDASDRSKSVRAGSALWLFAAYTMLLTSNIACVSEWMSQRLAAQGGAAAMPKARIPPNFSRAPQVPLPLQLR